MAADVLAALVHANLAAAAAVLLAMMLRRPMRRLAGARAAYALWLLPVACGLAVLLPHPSAPLAPVAAVTEAVFDAVPTSDGAGFAWPPLLLAAWAAGVAAAVVVLALRQAAFMAALGRVGPAVVGAIRPRIVTPDDFEVRFAPAEREVILAHERVHLACGDARINALAAALQCLCWFNPLVHLGVRRMRIDQELACDAAVLARFPAARRLYGELLLKTQLAAQPLPLGCHWPAGAEHPLKERIAMLKSPLPSRGRRAAGFAVVALAGAAAAATAWAAQPPATAAQGPDLAATPSAQGAQADKVQVAARADEPQVAKALWAAGKRPAGGPAEPLVTKPDWIKRPTPVDVMQWYPEEALRNGVAGGAIIACDVSATGQLEGCKVAREEPEGAGFGQAALAMSGAFQMKPQTRDGQPVAGGKVRIPIRFMMPTTK